MSDDEAKERKRKPFFDENIVCTHCGKVVYTATPETFNQAANDAASQEHAKVCPARTEVPA